MASDVMGRGQHFGVALIDSDGRFDLYACHVGVVGQSEVDFAVHSFLRLLHMLNVSIKAFQKMNISRVTRLRNGCFAHQRAR